MRLRKKVLSYQLRFLFLILYLKTLNAASIIESASESNISVIENISLLDRRTTTETTAGIPVEVHESWEDDERGSEIADQKSLEASHGARSWRLPNTTYPLRYHLHITTNVHREIFDYKGNCTIEIMVQENTDELVLNAEDLYIWKILIDDLSAGLSIADLLYRVDANLLIIKRAISNETDKPQIPGFLRNHRLRVEIHYSAVIGTSSVGFHKLTYTDKSGATVFGASTQFEPIHARSAMPCYDEPRFKSNFTISITHGSNYTAISNMPQDGGSLVSAEHNMTTTNFMESPPMSIYLLAFVISNYQNVSLQTKDIVQRIFLPPDVDYTDCLLILENGIRAIKAFGDLMDVRYALPKLDHVAVRESYGNAMENWGLIVYQDSIFLHTNRMDTFQRFRAIFTQNHELVHQWFGNLVSPEWWTYAWLNEGFASYYSYVLTDLVTPEYNAMDALQLTICHGSILSNDDTTMSQYVETPSDIRSKFGYVIYSRAPCVIQMLEYAFEKEVFRKGVSSYLKKHSYSVANENNLYDALQSAIDEHYSALSLPWNYSVHQIFSSWTNSRICPIVIITRNYDEHSNVIRIRQMPTHDVNETYWIPLNFATSTNPDFENATAVYFMPPVPEVTIDLNDFNLKLKPNDWLIVNKKSVGLYEIVYDNENLLRISAALTSDHNQIHPRNRAALFLNFWSFLLHDREEGTTADIIAMLELAKYLDREKDPFVWCCAANQLSSLLDYFKYNDETLKLLNQFLRQLIVPFYTQFKRENDSDFSLSQLFMLDDLDDLACSLNVPNCLAIKRKQMLKHMAGELEDDDYLVLQLCNAVKALNETEFETAMKYIAEQDEPLSWLGLACTPNDNSYAKLLAEVFNIESNAKHCSRKLEFIAEMPCSKRMADRELTWVMLEQNIERILNSTICDNSDAFVSNFGESIKYVDRRYKAKFLPIFEIYQKNPAVEKFTEADIGTAVKTKFVDNLEVINKWLSNELENNLIET